jgi:hypothetical protein
VRDAGSESPIAHARFALVKMAGHGLSHPIRSLVLHSPPTYSSYLRNDTANHSTLTSRTGSPQTIFIVRNKSRHSLGGLVGNTAAPRRSPCSKSPTQNMSNTSHSSEISKRGPSASPPATTRPAQASAQSRPRRPPPPQPPPRPPPQQPPPPPPPPGPQPSSRCPPQPPP